MKKILFFFLLAITAQAQLKLGNNIGTINANSVLEIEHTTKGMLLPRVSLTSTTSYSPLSATIVAGFMVYNTNAAATAGSSSYPINTGAIGVYYWDGSGWVATKSTMGTVTSVGGTGTVSGLSLSGTVTTTGNLTLGGTLAVTPSNFASQTANTVLAAPNGIAGVPTFRTLVAADIPTLNQNTTGTASNVTGTVAIANGGTGTTTAAGARTNLGATTVGANLFTLTNPSAITFPRFNADNTVSALDAATFRSAIGAGTSSTTGTVTSVGGTGTVSGLSLSGTVTTTGNLTLGGTLAVTPSNFASQTANTVLAAPNGIAGVPTFRTLVAADIPTLNQNTTGTASNVTGTVAIANGGTGTTTAAGARTNLGATTVGANLFTLTNPSAITFPRFNADNTVSALDAATFRSAIGAGTSSTTGTVTSVGGTGTVSGLSLSGTVTTTGNLTLGGTLAVTPSNFASQTANTILAAPNGTAGVPTFRALVAADIPTLNQNTTGTASNVTGTVAIANGGTGTTTAAGARTNLGATTVGANLFTLTNPSAITFPRFNADNTVSALDAATFRSAIGAGTGSGTVTSVAMSVPAFLSVSGSPVTSSGTLAVSYSGTALPIANGGTGGTTATAAKTNLGIAEPPTGGVMLWTTNSAPTGWLICDGTAVSRTTYSALFAAIGTVFGSGDGSTTFNLPNLTGRVPVGRDVGQTEFDGLAETGGAKTHTLSTSEIPSHTHSYTDGTASATAGWYATGGGAYNIQTNTLTGQTTGSAGSGAAHNNLQPYIVLNYIIKI